MFLMRFDMRAPEFGGSTTDLYKAAIDMAEWAETRGCLAAVISEHHTSSDGYIPSPLLLASAMAARTNQLYISIAAALLAFYDPIRLAEDMAVLDIISNGRLSYTLGLGYRPEEFEMYGIDWKQRGAVVEEKLQLLLKAKTGEPFTSKSPSQGKPNSDLTRTWWPSLATILRTVPRSWMQSRAYRVRVIGAGPGCLLQGAHHVA